MKDIRKRAIYTCCTVFGLSFFLCGFIVITDSLFIRHLGEESLPNAYIYESAFLMSFCFLLFFAARRISLQRILIYFLVVNLVIYGSVIPVLMWSSTPSPQYFLFLWVLTRVNNSLGRTILWMLIDAQWHTLDVYKLYSVFVSFQFLGFLASGFWVAVGVQLFGQYVDVFGLLLMMGMTIFCSAFLSRAATIEPLFNQSLFKKILRSPFVITLMVFAVVEELCWDVTEYNYFKAFSHSTAWEGDTGCFQFMGTLRALIGGVNILICLIVYPWCVKRWGMQKLIPYPYMFALSAYLVWKQLPPLLSGSVGMFAVESVFATFGDTAFNLYIKSVPVMIQAPVRLIIESWIEPLVILIAAFVLKWTKMSTLLVGGVLVLSTLIMSCVLRIQLPRASCLTSKKGVQRERGGDSAEETEEETATIAV